MEISVDRERCQGAGMCVLTAPESFDQDTEDGLVRLLHTRPPLRFHESTREAAELCPAGAITVIEHGNGMDRPD